MAILLKVDNPSDFLKKIYADIDDKSIDTWKYDKDGDFTHLPKQWINQAWLKQIKPVSPICSVYNLCFGIVPPQNIKIEQYIYGAYHGRFAEMLITHYPKAVKALQLTPLPLPGYDIV